MHCEQHTHGAPVLALQEFESLSRGLVANMPPALTCQLLHALSSLGFFPQWLWLSLATEPLQQTLPALARSHPVHLAQAVAGLHMQFKRPDSRTALAAAAEAAHDSLLAESPMSGKSSSGGRRGGTAGLRQGSRSESPAPLDAAAAAAPCKSDH